MNSEFIVRRPVFSKQCVHASARGIFKNGSSARTSLENAGRNAVYVLYVQTGRQYALASRLYYLKRNCFQCRFQSVEGLSYFFGLFSPASLSHYANPQNVK